MTTVPSPADNGPNVDGHTTPALRVVPDAEVLGADEFITWALLWRANGYPPLVLGGNNGKKLLVRHITGYSPEDATEAEIRSWPMKFRHVGEVNLGVRCPA